MMSPPPSHRWVLPMHRSLALGFTLAVVTSTACSSRVSPAGAPGPSGSTVASPDRGSLVVVGGGRVGPEIMTEFLRLAGGKQAPIVVIPTAGGDSAYAQ